MGTHLRKKPTILKKKKRPEDATSSETADPSAESDRAVATSEADAEARTRPAPPARKAQAAPAVAAAPPADNVFHAVDAVPEGSQIELKKVTWPSRQQTLGSTLVVIVLVMIISAFSGRSTSGCPA